MTLAVGVAAALAAAILYSVGVTLQAIEARESPETVSLRPSILKHLVTRRRWLIGTACVVGGWIAQVIALSFAPITIVQPALALSVVALLAIGCAFFGQQARIKEAAAAIAIAMGVGGLVAVSPPHGDGDAQPLPLAIGMTVLAVIALVPFLLRGHRRLGGVVVVSAGLAYAWCGFSTKFVADGVTDSAWLGAGLWLAATVVAAGLGLICEMTALQRRSAIRVFPVVLLVQIVVAVLLAPLLAGEGWSPDPLVLAGLGVSLAIVTGATHALARTTAVEAAIAA